MPSKTKVIPMLLIFVVIFLGFSVTFILGYNWNIRIAQEDVRNVAMLTSESIYNEITTIFAKPINVSLTMANDSLLKELLLEETNTVDDSGFLSQIQTYLNGYRRAYGYDSVFLVSTATGHYYHFNGLNRVLTEDNPENDWYYNFLASGDEYTLEIDNDEAADGEITVFINCRILGDDGTVFGVVGVGFIVDELQSLLSSYADVYGVNAYLMDVAGNNRVSVQETGYVPTSGADAASTPTIQAALSEHMSPDQVSVHWENIGGVESVIVLRYVEDIDWYLVIENDYAAIEEQLSRQLGNELLITLAVFCLVCLVVIWLFNEFNKRIVALTLKREQSHQEAFQQETSQLYENIHELNITKNCAEGESSRQYFIDLGIPPDANFDESLVMIAKSSVQKDYRQGYIDTFCTANAIASYERGETTLQYEMLTRKGSEDYHWMRIIGRIYYFEEDDTLRMFTYRQNIDEQKKKEAQMLNKAERDSLTGLLNKVATADHINQMLSESPGQLFALMILDIDNFKRVNDQYGHAIGDTVITEFANTLQSSFRQGDIVGRIGGDEFIVFLRLWDRGWISRKAAVLGKALCRKLDADSATFEVSASIGIALAPEAGSDFAALYKTADSALYQTKKRGKNGFTLYDASDITP